MCPYACLVHLCVVIVCVYDCVGVTTKPTDEFLLRFDEEFLPAVKAELDKVNIAFVKKILPGTYMFRDDGKSTDVPEVIKQNTHLKDKVGQFERVIEYVVEMWTKMPEKPSSNVLRDAQKTSKVSTYFDMGVEGAWRMNYTGRGVVIGVTDVGVNIDIEDLTPNIVEPEIQTYFDMGVEGAWRLNYTRRGVVIGVTDVGVNIDIDDLTPNINSDLSYNAVDDMKISDVTPEQFDDYEKTLTITDHGNRCVGMIAALKNSKCGDGVAYDAKIAVLRIFNASFDPMDADHPHGQIHFRYARVAEGMSHVTPSVDIFSNSWGTPGDFMPMNPLLGQAISNSIKQGRGGKGVIHVFPADRLADSYANSVYTIAVTSLGQHGHVTEFSHACAATLTSAYGKGCANMTLDCDTSRMMTTSRNRGCTLEFEGTSASTAIVSGIIALALQANPNLGWRDVQHIVVEASEAHKDMAKYGNFLTNGAGKLYHPVLGFGLLNATKLVKLAKDRTSKLPGQLRMWATSEIPAVSPKKHEAKMALKCMDTLCINSIEHVVLTISFTAPRVYRCHVTLVSPAGTRSLILDKEQLNGTGEITGDKVEFLSVNFWGETVEGTWTVSVENDRDDNFQVTAVNITVYGSGVGTPAGPHVVPYHTIDNNIATQGQQGEAVPEPHKDKGSASVVFYIVGLVGVAGFLFFLGFREMLRNKTRSQYAAIKL